MVFVISIQVWAHIWFRPYGMDVYDFTHSEIGKFLDTVPNITDKELASPPVSGSLAIAYKAAQDAFDRIPRDAEKENFFSLTSVDLSGSDVDKILPPYEETLKIGEWLSQRIEIDLETVKPGDLLPLYSPHHTIRFPIALLFQGKAETLVSAGKIDDAFARCMDTLPLLVRCPYQDFRGYFENRVAVNDVLYKADCLWPNGSVPAQLSSWLKTLNRLEPFLIGNHRDDILRLYLIDRLRSLDRKSIVIRPGKRARYYVHQIAQLQYKEMNFWINLFRCWQKLISGEQFWRENFQGLMRPFDFSNTINNYYYFQSFTMPDVSIGLQNELGAGLILDGLRLKMAAKLYELETGKKVTGTGDLVPTYLPEEIRERKTGKSYRWDSDGELVTGIQ